MSKLFRAFFLHISLARLKSILYSHFYNLRRNNKSNHYAVIVLAKLSFLNNTKIAEHSGDMMDFLVFVFHLKVLDTLCL